MPVTVVSQDGPPGGGGCWRQGAPHPPGATRAELELSLSASTAAWAGSVRAGTPQRCGTGLSGPSLLAIDRSIAYCGPAGPRSPLLRVTHARRHGVGTPSLLHPALGPGPWLRLLAPAQAHSSMCAHLPGWFSHSHGMIAPSRSALEQQGLDKQRGLGRVAALRLSTLSFLSRATTFPLIL